jgi:hypothetical protein
MSLDTCGEWFYSNFERVRSGGRLRKIHRRGRRGTQRKGRRRKLSEKNRASGFLTLSSSWFSSAFLRVLCGEWLY